MIFFTFTHTKLHLDQFEYSTEVGERKRGTETLEFSLKLISSTIHILDKQCLLTQGYWESPLIHKDIKQTDH